MFLRALFTTSDEVQGAIRALEDILVAEERMAVADVVVGMHELSSEALKSTSWYLDRHQIFSRDLIAVRTTTSAIWDTLDECRSLLGRSAIVAQATLSELRECERRRRTDSTSSDRVSYFHSE